MGSDKDRLPDTLGPLGYCCVYDEQGIAAAEACEQHSTDPMADWREDCVACGHAPGCHTGGGPA